MTNEVDFSGKRRYNCGIGNQKLAVMVKGF